MRNDRPSFEDGTNWSSPTELIYHLSPFLPSFTCNLFERLEMRSDLSEPWYLRFILRLISDARTRFDVTLEVVKCIKYIYSHK